MDVEAQIAVARRIVKVEAAITQVEVDPRVERVVERADHLPVGMRAEVETADIAIGAQAKPVAEIKVISADDQRVAPAGSLVDALTGKQTGVQLQIRSKSPSAEAGTKIRELGRRFEDAVQQQRGPRIGLQLRLATLEEYIAGGDVGADRDMQHIAEQADGPVVDLGRPHERHPVEVSQQLKGADARIDLGNSRQRRRGGGIDAGQPEVGRDKDLRMPKAART